MKKNKIAIIGSGPGGMNAALYAARASLDVTIIEKGIAGGQLLNTDEVENLIGFGLISGFELSQKMSTQLKEYNNIKYYRGQVEKLEKTNENFQIHTNNEIMNFDAVIVATGNSPRKLNIPGEIEGSGRGVSYCAVCDGGFFKNREVVVIGGGDSALEEAIYLANLCSKVTIIHRRKEFRATPIYQQKVLNNPKIELILDSVVQKINIDQVVESVEIKNLLTNEISTLKTSGVFIYVGSIPQTKFIKNLDIVDENGYIFTNAKMETAIKGLYAIGDVRTDSIRQIVTALGDGAVAAQMAYHHINFGD